MMNVEKNVPGIEITETVEVPDEIQTPEVEVKVDIEKKIQSEIDRVRTKYVKALKEKDSEIEKIKKSQMSETEKIQYELQQKNAELEMKVKELREKEMKLKIVEKLREKNIMELQDFIAIPENEDEIDDRITDIENKFNSLIQKRLENEIKNNGRTQSVLGKQNISNTPVNLREWQKKYLD